MLEKLSSDIFLDPKGEGVDNLFEILALNYFWDHLQMMLNFSEIVPRNVYDCGRRVVAYVIIFLDIRVWEGDTSSQDKNFSEMYAL